MPEGWSCSLMLRRRRHQRRLYYFLATSLFVIFPIYNVLIAVRWHSRHSRSMEQRTNAMFPTASKASFRRDDAIYSTGSNNSPRRSREKRSRLATVRDDRFGKHQRVLSLFDRKHRYSHADGWRIANETLSITISRSVASMGESPETCCPEYKFFYKRRWDYNETTTCKPMADWQSHSFPTCNLVHEVSLPNMVFTDRFLGKGVLRMAWLVADTADGNRHGNQYVFRTQLMRPRLGEIAQEAPNLYEKNRIDALAMERLTSSPHVIKEYAYCGQAIVTEAGERTLLKAYYTRNREKVNNTLRLSVGAQVAHTLAEAHNMGRKVNDDAQTTDTLLPTFAHGDFHRNNLLVTADGRILLNDFNQGIFLHSRFDNGTEVPCLHTNRRVFGLLQYQRPPERFNIKGHYRPDKVDIFGLGSILLELITGRTRNFREYREASRAVLRGPRVAYAPVGIHKSNETAVVAMLYAARACFAFDPNQRPSARRVAVGLKTALEWATRNETKFVSEDNGAGVSESAIQALFLDDKNLFAELLAGNFGTKAADGDDDLDVELPDIETVDDDHKNKKKRPKGGSPKQKESS